MVDNSDTMRVRMTVTVEVEGGRGRRSFLLQRMTDDKALNGLTGTCYSIVATEAPRLVHRALLAARAQADA